MNKEQSKLVYSRPYCCVLAIEETHLLEGSPDLRPGGGGGGKVIVVPGRQDNQGNDDDAVSND